MTGRRASILLALAAVAVLAVITFTGNDDDPAVPPPAPGESPDEPGEDPLAEIPDAGEESGPGDSAPPKAVPPPAGDGPSSLLVTVNDVTGKPVAGACLRILELGKYKTGSFGGAAVDQILMGIEVVDKGSDPPGKLGVTTGDGTCLFEGLMPTIYFVGVLAAGKSPGEAQVAVPEEGQAEVSVSVGPGAVLAGRVVDARGNPVPGARVLSCVWRRMTKLPYASMEMMESGSNGSFRFTSAVPEKRHILCARAPDGRMAISVRIRAPKEDLLLKLNRRITLVGKVYEEGTGIPVAGAKLYAMLGTATSKEDGSYRMEGVAKSLFFRWVMIQKEGYQQKYHEIDFATSLFGGSEITVDFTIVKTIPGRLFISTQDTDGTPIPGVAVTVTSSGNEKQMVRGITDARGDLELSDVPPHSARLEARKPGYVHVRFRHRMDGERFFAGLDEQWVRLEPGGEATVEVVLAKEATARGVVRDQEGKPLEGVDVGGLTESDTEGRFELNGLPLGVQVGIGFRKEGFVPGHHRIVPGEASGVEVTLNRASKLSGRVLDPRGNPVAKARVNLLLEKGGDQADWVRTSGTGTFEFDGLAAGRYVLEVRAKNYATTRGDAIEIGGGATGEIDLVLEPGILLVIRARTEGGRQARVYAWLHGPLELPESERIDLEVDWFSDEPREVRLLPGRYRIAAVPDKSVTGAGAVEETRELTADGEVVVTFGSKPAFITARLPPGAGAGSLQIRRTDPATPKIRIWAPHPGGGTLRSQALPPGKYKVLVFYSTDNSDSWVGKEFMDVEPGGPVIEVTAD